MAKKMAQSEKNLFGLVFDLLVLAATAVIAGIYVWPIKHMPFHLDAAKLIVNGAQILTERNFDSLVLAEYGIGHPTLFMVYLASLWQIWGQNIQVSHFSMVPFLIVFLYSSYLFFKKFLEIELAVLAMLVIAMLPVVVSQYQIISLSVAIAALTSLSLVWWWSKKYYLALLVLGVAALIQPTALVFLPALIVDWWFHHRKVLRFQSFVLPVGFLVIWYLYQGSVTGWWIIAPERGLIWPDSPVIYLRYSAYVLRMILFSQFYAVLSLPLLIFTGWLVASKSAPTKFIRLARFLAILLVATAGFYGLVGEFYTLKVIFILPLMVVTTTLASKLALEKLLGGEDYSWLTGGLLVGFIFIALTQWRTDPARQYNLYFAPDQNLYYQEQIILGQQLAGYLQLNYPNAQVFGGSPEDFYLNLPHLGYVNQPLNFSYCSQFEYDENQEQVIVIHPYHSTQLSCNQVIQEHSTASVHQINQNGRWAEVFLVTGEK